MEEESPPTADVTAGWEREFGRTGRSWSPYRYRVREGSLGTGVDSAGASRVADGEYRAEGGPPGPRPHLALR